MFTRVIFFILLLVNIVLVFRIIWSDSGILTYLQIKDEYSRLCEENKKIKLENIKLSNDIRMLKSDKDYLADVIRREMNYVKKNEIVYIFDTGKK